MVLGPGRRRTAMRTPRHRLAWVCRVPNTGRWRWLPGAPDGRECERAPQDAGRADTTITGSSGRFECRSWKRPAEAARLSGVAVSNPRDERIASRVERGVTWWRPQMSQYSVSMPNSAQRWLREASSKEVMRDLFSLAARRALTLGRWTGPVPVRWGPGRVQRGSPRTVVRIRYSVCPP